MVQRGYKQILRGGQFFEGLGKIFGFKRVFVWKMKTGIPIEKICFLNISGMDNVVNLEIAQLDSPWSKGLKNVKCGFF